MLRFPQAVFSPDEPAAPAPETPAAVEPAKGPGQPSLVSDPPKEPEAPKEPTKEPAKEPEKPAEPAKVDVAQLKLPEGFKSDEAQMKGFTDLLSNPEIKPQDRAQALIDLHTKALKDASEATSKAWDEVTTKWVSEVAADKELGTGDPKNPLKTEVRAGISKLLDQFGGTELRQALDLTGAGNNPHVIRAFAKMASKLTEGGPVVGSPATKPKTGAAALYPDNPEG